MFVFTPTTSRNYDFYAAGSDKGKVRVLDANGKLVAPKAEDIRQPVGDSSQYKSEYEFAATAGETYYLQAINSDGATKFTAGLLNGSEETRQDAAKKISTAKTLEKNTAKYKASTLKVIKNKRTALETLLKDPQASIKKLQNDINELDAANHAVKLKSNNTLKIKARTATVKYSKLKKKAQVLSVTKAIKFTSKGQGTKKYTLYTVKKGKKSYKKYFKINSKTGKLTVKRRLKKGTYRVTIKVKAAGNGEYKASAVKKVTSKVRVR